MRKHSILWLGLLSALGLGACSNQPSSSDAKVYYYTQAQQQQLLDEQLNAEYLSGCVTEHLEEAVEAICEQSRVDCQLSSEQGSLLPFEQTLAIYKQCQVDN